MSILTQTKIFCVILGGGGHARVVVDCLKSLGAAHPCAVLDQDRSLWGKEVLGVPIRGGLELLPKLKAEGATYFVPAVGGVGDNNPRRRIFDAGLQHGLTALTLIHPSATVSPHAQIGQGTVIFAGAIINAGVIIGDNCIINTGAIIDHDCRIGDHVHIAPGAVLSGEVCVARSAHLGTGASVIQGIHIGEEAIVGAGGVVVRNISPRSVVKGVPAK
ncbi:MAG: acetyltransferase [Deltaproteobacteria bacterium]|nr:acetyltransferase [Deltaproteobacteria bacterium]